jgi:hypothetical protein
MRPMRRLPPLFASLVLASCSSGEKPVDQRALPIVNGTIDTGDPAVVSLTYLRASFCSGTLVAPEVVVTAAHCIDPEITGGIPPEDMDVFFGTDVQAGGTEIHVIHGEMHPDWNRAALAHDIACLRLAGPATVEPAKMNRSAMTDGDVGKLVRIVGFGVTSPTPPGMSGTKRQALSMILGVDATTFTYGDTPGQTCFGDSGGPGFMTLGDGTEYLVGVTSAGDEGCEFFGIDTRVDIYIDGFIQPCIDATAPGDCGMDGICKGGCSPPDPDCGGDPCSANGACTLGCPVRDPDCFCFPGDGYCDLGCPTVDPDCTGDIPMGQPCGNNLECQEGLCIHSVDDLDFKYCTRACTNDPTLCMNGGIGGAHMDCIATVDPDLKVCAYPAPSPGVTGATCNTGADCWSGVCVPAVGAPGCRDGTCNMCTRGCLAELGADCELGYSCQTTMVGTDELHVCLPAPAAEGWCSTTRARGTGTGATGGALLLLSALVVILRRNERRRRR